MNKPEILIIDDEEQIRNLLQISLRSEGYHTTSAANGKEGLIMASNHPPDLVILDLGLPDRNGLEVLRELREWFTNPVVILSVQDSEAVIIQALDAGANDYVSKPWRSGELLARIRSALRITTPEEIELIVGHEDLSVDLHSRTVKKKGELIKLTTTEYSLLSLFARNDGKVLTHQYLLRTVWGPGFINQSQYLRVFIAQIRKKIEDDPNKPEYLITESGLGYRLLISR